MAVFVQMMAIHTTVRALLDLLGNLVTKVGRLVF